MAALFYLGGDGRSSFRLASRNGTKLLTTIPLDRETKSTYELIVRTEDCLGDAVCSAEGGEAKNLSEEGKTVGRLKP